MGRWFQGHIHEQLSDLNIDKAPIRSWDELRRDPDWRHNARFLDRLYTLLDRIPAIERDVIELYFYKSKRQETIARMLGLSQQTVSHRMYSAFRRIMFMMEQPEVTPDRMRRDLKILLKNPLTVAVLCDFAQTSSQTATAKNLGVIQQRVCRHLNAAMHRLRKVISLDSLFYVTYFERLMENRNILHEVPGSRRPANARLEAECARAARRIMVRDARGGATEARRPSTARRPARRIADAVIGRRAPASSLQDAGAA